MHEIDRYIANRYERWLDYSTFHCGLSGIPDEAVDVLNEVLCSLLQKDRNKLLELLSAKKNGYTELDFFVLRMIKLNAHSLTSPYRSKYKPLPADSNVDYATLNIEDTKDEEEDNAEIILERFRRVREAFESLGLSPIAHRIFEFRFFEDIPFSEWEGAETLKELYDIYNGVQELIRDKLNGNSLF